jgi:L-iditol 2-dehydrogenase
MAIPFQMKAAVYKGNSVVEVDSVPVPEIGPGEVLIRVESCGICPTDLKKIEYNLLPGPRIYGHETAGVIAAVGAGVTKYQPGDRVIAFHHIPCGDCFYCSKKLYAQCPVYKKVGVTAGYEPAGGGFSQYVRVMDWIVEGGIEKFDERTSFDQACFVEPINTCVKGLKLVDPQPGDVVAVLGQGPVGMMFTMLVARTGARLVVTDTIEDRRKMALSFGADEAFDPREEKFGATVRQMTEGRGADIVIVAASAKGIVEQAVACSRPGAKILLFAQTSHQERIDLSGADICVGERILCGSYSASVDVQKEAAELVFSGVLPLERLVSNRYALNDIHTGIQRALHPGPESLKIVVQPQR